MTNNPDVIPINRKEMCERIGKINERLTTAAKAFSVNIKEATKSLELFSVEMVKLLKQEEADD